jgi:hypothetical protein
VITKDVPAGALAVERAEHATVKGYRKRADAKRRSGGSSSERERSPRQRRSRGNR